MRQLRPAISNRDTVHSPTIDLFCLPFAGGSGMLFRQWQKRAPKGMRIHPISLPGRDRHFHLAPLDRMPAMLAWIDQEITALATDHYALFGHSMGGIIAYAHALQRHCGNQTGPGHLFISASAPRPKPAASHLHTKSAAEMRHHLRRFDPEGYCLDAHPELWTMFEPVLRADFKLVETYLPPVDAAKISCPITALSGTADTVVDADAMAAWRHKTTGAFDAVTIDGGHLFIRDNPMAVLDCVSRRLLHAP